MTTKLISLNLMDILAGETLMTNVNISITPVVDNVQMVEERKAILGSTMQNDESLNTFISEVQTALEKLVVARGL